MSKLSFCPTLAELYRDRVVTGRSGKLHTELGSLSTVNNLLAIRTLMMETRPERTLEVGLAYGGSALTIAQTHMDLGFSPCHQHIAIDPSQSGYWDDAATVLLERADLSGFVRVIPEHSSQALPVLVRQGMRFQFAYIDGSHEFMDVLLDFNYTDEMLDIGGLILFDDASDTHVRKVLRFITSNYQDAYEYVSLGRLRSPFARRIVYAVAERVGRTQLAVFRKRRSDRPPGHRRLKCF